MSRYKMTLWPRCPHCTEKVEVETTVFHDPGVWRTANGDGRPESYDLDHDHPKTCPECEGDLETQVFSDLCDEAWSDRDTEVPTGPEERDDE